MAALEVHPARETDLPRLVDIQFSAFRDDPYQAGIFPGDPASGALRRQVHDLLLDWWRRNPVARWTTCVDPADGAIVGFAEWYVREHARPEAEWRARPSAYWLPAGGRARAVAERFLHTNARLREEIWGGRPYLLLNLLAIHEDHQRRGAGTLLVQDGLALARAKGLTAYLEASADGYHLYRKLGFREVDRAVITAAESGGERDCVLVAMVKDPETPSSLSVQGELAAERE